MRRENFSLNGTGALGWVVLLWVMEPAAALAEFPPTQLTVTGTGDARAPVCEAMRTCQVSNAIDSCEPQATGQRCTSLVVPQNTQPISVCTAGVYEVYCCDTTTQACPTSTDVTVSCIPIAPDVAGAASDVTGVCSYSKGVTFCPGSDGKTTNATLLRCLTPMVVVGAAAISDYALGDCDQDSIANAKDPCICDAQNRCVSADAGSDASSDGAASDAAEPRADAQRGNALEGLNFRGGGGCTCSANGAPWRVPMASTSWVPLAWLWLRRGRRRG